VSIGRARDNTVVLDDLSVSRRHAEIRYSGGQWVIRDLGSSFGTFVDGRRVSESPITEHSLIAVGRGLFRMVDGTLEEYQDTGAVSFGARNLSVEIAGRRLLHHIDFYLQPNSMLVIIGPSGSGKTTLLRALTGTRPADTGNVVYGGRDLYSNYDEIRDRIGFVPQDDILHPQLRVVDALLYAARLRFPRDTDAATRAQRVRDVIAELGLEAQAQQRVATLSGGQRKRTSTAMELLTKPSLLFLDEPTSGLDINRDREVMHMLRNLADAGRTVIVVSHNVGYVHLADRILVLATGGHLAYFGRPQETLGYFGQDDWADMYASLEDSERDWRGRFDESPQAVDNRDPQADVSPAIGRSSAEAVEQPPRRRKSFDQFRTLCRRYLSVVVADRQFIALLIATPLILAVFAHTVPGGAGLSEHAAIRLRTRGPIQLLLVLVVGCCMMGTATSLREIVKERAILTRERTVGLSWVAYLGSKTIVLCVFTAIQAVVLTVLGVAGSPQSDSSLVGPSALTDIAIAFLLVAVASMAIGLCVSAIVTNSDRALPILVVVLMAQLLFSGGLFPLQGRAVLEQLSWLSPARWGFAAGAAVTDAGHEPGWRGDPLWEHSSSVYLTDVAMLVAVTAFYLVIAALLVRRIGRLTAKAAR
jgi:ABC-type multidrug transport system ATPase subunit